MSDLPIALMGAAGVGAAAMLLSRRPQGWRRAETVARIICAHSFDGALRARARAEALAAVLEARRLALGHQPSEHPSKTEARTLAKALPRLPRAEVLEELAAAMRSCREDTGAIGRAYGPLASSLATELRIAVETTPPRTPKFGYALAQALDERYG